MNWAATPTLGNIKNSNNRFNNAYCEDDSICALLFVFQWNFEKIKNFKSKTNEIKNNTLSMAHHQLVVTIQIHAKHSTKKTI